MLVLSLLGCKKPDATLLQETGSMAGYYPLRIETELDVSEVSVGGVRGFDLVETPTGVEVWIHGGPKPGATDVVLQTSEGEIVLEGAFTFDKPIDPLFDEFYAIGGSLTQGVQGGVPLRHGQLHAPSTYMAQQAGAWHPLPLLVEDLFPRISGAEATPPPACELPDVVSFLASAAVEVIQKMNDVENDRVGFYLARVDADLEPYDLGVGDTHITDLVHGVRPDEFSQQFLAHLVYDPYGDIAGQVPVSQLEIVEAGNPTLVVSTDTYGNDLIGAIVRSAKPDPAVLTPVDEVAADLDELSDRLAATGAESFLANIPRATLLPLTNVKYDLAVANGADPAELDEALAEIERVGELYAEALEEAAARHDNVHVVDFAGEVARIEKEGFPIGDTTLSVSKLGGLLSTDGVHFSDVGYAMLGNLFLDTIEAELGVDVPRVELEPILEGDPYAPKALLDDGLDPRCLPDDITY